MNEISMEMNKELAIITHDIVEVANSIIIKTEHENTTAATLMAGWKQEKKRRVEIFAPSKKATKNAYDEVRKLESAAIDPIDEAIATVNSKCGTYVQMENARRSQLQAIEDAKVTELQRKEDERVAKLQAKAELAGKPIPEVAPRIIPQRTVAAVSAPAGTSYQEYWSAEVTSIIELCRAVVVGKADAACVMANMVYLNGLAKLEKVEGTLLPGVTAKKRIGTTQR